MATVRDLLALVDDVAPMARAADWDVVGLILGDPDAEVERVAVCHDVTDAVVAEAIERGIDTLVAYHPLLFRPVNRLVPGSGPAGLAFRLLGAGVNLIVVHTGLDGADDGAADRLGRAIGLSSMVGFGDLGAAPAVKLVTFVPHADVPSVVDALAEAGAGSIGSYRRCVFKSEGSGSFDAGTDTSPAIGNPGQRTEVGESRIEMVVPLASLERAVAALVAAHPYEEPAFDVYERTGSSSLLGRLGSLDTPVSSDELAATVSSAVGGVVRVADAERNIRTVAVIPGSGGDFIDVAMSMGAEAIVTGDVSHHRARAALARGVTVIDPGHAATERPGLAGLYAALAERWDGEVADMTQIDGDPWRSV